MAADPHTSAAVSAVIAPFFAPNDYNHFKGLRDQLNQNLNAFDSGEIAPVADGNDVLRFRLNFPLGKELGRHDTNGNELHFLEYFPRIPTEAGDVLKLLLARDYDGRTE